MTEECKSTQKNNHNNQTLTKTNINLLWITTVNKRFYKNSSSFYNLNKVHKILN